MSAPAGPSRDGEVGPRLRQLREQKTLSARQVADLAGLTPAYLSRLENGRVSPTVTTLARLVAAMGETMATLFQEPPDARETVVRRADRHLMRSRGVLDSQVTPGWATRLEILESLVEPGQGSSDRLHTHAGDEECVLVLEGALDLYLGADRHQLHTGDSATFGCRTPHRWRNPTTVPSRVLWVITPASY
ncbi:MAG TPA: cupin domain-containing protein [Nocardioides sp.]|jgi:transcriptional regulator with XRE-family HTH domain|uniref:cupin domain-containing protein n=1 Tax=Nocardioides sp. TaxID=35761 RepID=UPI002E367F24|nr:cupin domain-containing protein [Nocardioides sp.]HEX3932807.1 cupin domain-containing protein [Nocardioides sp.]